MSRWLRVLIWTVVVAVVVVLLFTVVFPRVERMLEDPTMAAGAPSAVVPHAAATTRAAPGADPVRTPWTSAAQAERSPR